MSASWDGFRALLHEESRLLGDLNQAALALTDALVEALLSGKIHAALDVTDPEPLPLGHPLWSAPNLLITPHIAGSSPGMMDRVMRFIGDQCRRYLAGEPLAHIVTEGY